MHVSRRLIGALAAAGALMAIPLVVWANVGAEAATDTLLSQGRPATASSVESEELSAGNTVDGDGRTRWGSEEGVDPQWIAVDLGAVHPVTRVRLRWETAYGKAYEIQTSPDGENWKTIYGTTSGDGGTDDLTRLSGEGRFVRMYGSARGTKWGYSIFDFEVYGTGPTAGDAPSARKPGRASQAPLVIGSDVPRPSRSAATRTATPTGSGVGTGLADPAKKDIAMQLVSSAENSSLDWKAQYRYIEDIGDGRGYTAGIIGFCSGTGDMLDLVEAYTQRVPGNPLAPFLPALRKVNGSASHAGLDGFPAAWAKAAADPQFTKAQDDERDRVYFDPAVAQAKADGVGALGQFAYYDAMVMHGPGPDADSFGGIRKAAMAKARPPAQGGSESAYLTAFLDARAAAMRTEAAHSDTSRVDTAQRQFLQQGNLDLHTPLTWKVYGESYRIG
ncbi:chitosanase [Dactylosporangium matsuzakiense]|uniref:chitosanase n=1 Tax=Dactylosporangium matsuzakiense TaxID=53360 RepID=UPI0021C48B16|nr:chitosanase [Dactylosporangium matsuzakiense]